MTPQEALTLVSQVTERFLGTKQDHINLAEAIEVLARLVNAAEQQLPKE